MCKIQGGSDKSEIFFFFLLNGMIQLEIRRFYWSKKNEQSYILTINIFNKTAVSCEDSLDPGLQAQMVLPRHRKRFRIWRVETGKKGECATLHTLPGDYGAVLLHLHDGSVQQHLDITQTPAHSTENRVNYKTFNIIVSLVEKYWG